MLHVVGKAWFLPHVLAVYVLGCFIREPGPDCFTENGKAHTGTEQSQIDIYLFPGQISESFSGLNAVFNILSGEMLSTMSYPKVALLKSKNKQTNKLQILRIYFFPLFKHFQGVAAPHMLF